MLKATLKHYLVLIRYATVGTVGTAIDVGSLWVFVDLLRIPVLIGTALSFVLAVINNFVLNKYWTFGNHGPNIKRQFTKFCIVSVVGLVLTEICMAFFVYALGIWYVASKLATSAIVLTWNFLANKNWTFHDATRQIAYVDRYEYGLTIVIPAFNEERRIVGTLEAVDRYFRGQKTTREIIVVDDGSSDDTAGAVNAMRERIHDLFLVRYPKNRGKGHAVKAGVERSRGEYILFADADNSTPIEEFEKFLPLLKEHQIVIGSRYIAGSNITIKQPKYRIALGRIGNFLIQVFLLDNIRDTQCGFKALRHNAAKDIFSRMKVNRFGFDIELLSIARNLRYSIREVPISWLNSSDSRVRPVKDALRTFTELLYIKANLWSGRYE